MQIQGKSTLNSLLTIGIYYCENFTKSKFDVAHINTVKSTAQQVRVFKRNGMFETKHSKTNRL